MSGICERGFMLMFKKFGILGALSESLEPHLFGRTGALKFGTIGVHRSDSSQKVVKLVFIFTFFIYCTTPFLLNNGNPVSSSFLQICMSFLECVRDFYVSQKKANTFVYPFLECVCLRKNLVRIP